MMNYFSKFKSFALPMLRIGMALVFIWFGLNQLNNPEKWVAFLPTWTEGLPISQIQFVLVNGWFEVIAAIALILGAYTNIVAFLLGIHLLGIAISIGLNPTGIRDFGLAIAVLSLSLLGAGKYSMDNSEGMS